MRSDLLKTGSELDKEDKNHVLRAYLNRITRTRRPVWAKQCPTQFADDADWLANTRFAVTRSGKLDMRARYCWSSPTWPDNPELQTADLNTDTDNAQ